jgi:hypothetical protein
MYPAILSRIGWYICFYQELTNDNAPFSSQTDQQDPSGLGGRDDNRYGDESFEDGQEVCNLCGFHSPNTRKIHFPCTNSYGAVWFSPTSRHEWLHLSFHI